MRSVKTFGCANTWKAIPRMVVRCMMYEHHLGGQRTIKASDKIPGATVARCEACNYAYYWFDREEDME